MAGTEFSIWVNGTDDQLAAGAATYNLPLFGVRAVFSLNWYRTIMPDDVDLDLMRVSLENAPGVGESRTFEIYGHGAVATGVIVTISGTDTTGQDLVNVAGFAPGVDGYLKCTASAGAATTRVRYSFRCGTYVEGQTVLSGVGDRGPLHNTLTRYQGLGGAALWSGVTTSAQVRLVFPCAGTVSRLYAELSVAPGDRFGNHHGRQFTVFDQDGATTLTCTVTNPALAANDTTHSFTVAAGDYIYVECVPVSGFPGFWPNGARSSVSVAFVPDTPGQFIIPNNSEAMEPTGGTMYRQVSVGTAAWNGTEAEVRGLAQAMQITRIQVVLDAAPSSFDDDRGYSFVLYKNGATTSFGCGVKGLSTLCFSTGSIVIADDDLLSQRMTPDTTPGNPLKRTAAVSYLAEPLADTRQHAASVSLF